MASAAQPLISPAEYLEAEGKAHFRSEYFRGRMYAMAGGTRNHAVIIMNLGASLHQRLADTDCTVTSSNWSICVGETQFYGYPDLIVACGEPRYLQGRSDILLNPKVIVEVLSPSTEAYDRGFKAQQYRTIASLQEYALVSQDEARVEMYRRTPDNLWVLSEWVGMNAECRFASLDRLIPLSAVYQKVTFDES